MITLERIAIIALLVFMMLVVPDMLTTKPSIEVAQPVEQSTEKVEAQIDDRSLLCLSRNLYHEARGEGTEGMLAVAHVVVNRVRDHRWPSDVCEVIYQKNQFSWVGRVSGKIHEPKAYEEARTIAERVLSGLEEDFTKGSTFFHATYVKPFNKLVPTIRIGKHVFYKKPDTRPRAN